MKGSERVVSDNKSDLDNLYDGWGRVKRLGCRQSYVGQYNKMISRLKRSKMNLARVISKQTREEVKQQEVPAFETVDNLTYTVGLEN